MYVVAIVDCTHIGSATASLVTCTGEHYSRYFDRDQLWPPLDMVTIGQKPEPYRPNRTKRESFVVVLIVNRSCVLKILAVM